MKPPDPLPLSCTFLDRVGLGYPAKTAAWRSYRYPGQRVSLRSKRRMKPSKPPTQFDLSGPLELDQFVSRLRSLVRIIDEQRTDFNEPLEQLARGLHRILRPGVTEIAAGGRKVPELPARGRGHLPAQIACPSRKKARAIPAL